MSSQLDRLVPVLDGTNYCQWSVLMQSFLQMQELWEVIGGRHHMPAQPTPVATDVSQAAQAAFQAAQNAHDELYATWNIADSKPIGALTLRLAPQLRHYQTAAQQLWINLERAFGAPSMSAIFADFKVVMGSKLSGGNPVPEIERMAELFRRLALNNFLIADALLVFGSLVTKPEKDRNWTGP